MGEVEVFFEEEKLEIIVKKRGNPVVVNFGYISVQVDGKSRKIIGKMFPKRIHGEIRETKKEESLALLIVELLESIGILKEEPKYLFPSLFD